MDTWQGSGMERGVDMDQTRRDFFKLSALGATGILLPHGFSLAHHAKERGEEALPVLEYLQSLGAS